MQRSGDEDLIKIHFHTNIPGYLALALLFIVFDIVLLTVVKRKLILGLLMTYLFSTLMMLFSIYIESILAPSDSATAFCVSLAILPFLLHDAAIRTLCHRIIMSIIFVIIAYPVKDPEIFVSDIINIVIYGFLGTVASMFYNKTQMSALYLRRNMKKEIKIRTEQIERLSLQSMTAMSLAIDAKDTYTNGHSLRVAKYSKMIADKMGKSDSEQDNIYYIAMLHDVGKIGVPDTTINKPDKLSDEEFEEIKKHPLVGYDILKKLKNCRE